MICMYVRDVSIGMESEYLWSVWQRESLNIVNVLLNSLEQGNAVAFVEIKGWLEHSLTKPELHTKEVKGKILIKSQVSVHLGVCVQQSLVIVVSHSASILDLTNHVLDCSPRHTLYTQKSPSSHPHMHTHTHTLTFFRSRSSRRFMTYWLLALKSPWLYS